ncbi:hypothetical protein ACE6H2_015299 [Prunus campanulata]
MTVLSLLILKDVSSFFIDYSCFNHNWGWGGANFFDMTKYYFSLCVPVEVAQNSDYLLL